MIIIGGDKVEKEFKKLSDDSMFKAVFSDKKYMSWLLERFLGRKIDDYSIINKFDNQEVDTKVSSVHVRKKSRFTCKKRK